MLDFFIGIFALLFIVMIAVFFISTIWVIFEKADKPGRASVIPVYHTLVLIEIAGKPAWWIFLFLIPFVNLLFIVLMISGLAKAYNKGPGFGIGLILLPFIFFPILAFGEAKYSGNMN